MRLVLLLSATTVFRQTIVFYFDPISPPPVPPLLFRLLPPPPRSLMNGPLAMEWSVIYLCPQLQGVFVDEFQWVSIGLPPAMMR